MHEPTFKAVAGMAVFTKARLIRAKLSGIFAWQHGEIAVELFCQAQATRQYADSFENLPHGHGANAGAQLQSATSCRYLLVAGRAAGAPPRERRSSRCARASRAESGRCRPGSWTLIACSLHWLQTEVSTQTPAKQRRVVQSTSAAHDAPTFR